MNIWLTSLIAFTALSCAPANVGKKQETISPEEKAQELMNDGDFVGAIALLEPLVENEPEGYARFPLLAAAYAGLAGVDIISILKSMLTGGDTASPFALILDFIPEDATEESADILDKGVSILNQIPIELIGAEGDEAYGTSAELQLVLYQTVYATMLLRLTLNFDANGEIDLDSLENLSLEDARRILDALGGAAAVAPSGENAQAVGGSVQSTLDDIDSQEGDDDAERLRNYLGSS